jgi:hypothetical protein
MKHAGRPRKELRTITANIKITPEKDMQINIIIANQYTRVGESPAEDRSHFVRLAIENYIDEFYSDKV